MLQAKVAMMSSVSVSVDCFMKSLYRHPPKPNRLSLPNFYGVGVNVAVGVLVGVAVYLAVGRPRGAVAEADGRACSPVFEKAFPFIENLIFVPPTLLSFWVATARRRPGSLR